MEGDIIRTGDTCKQTKIHQLDGLIKRYRRSTYATTITYTYSHKDSVEKIAT